MLSEVELELTPGNDENLSLADIQDSVDVEDATLGFVAAFAPEEDALVVGMMVNPRPRKRLRKESRWASGTLVTIQAGVMQFWRLLI